MYANNKEDSIMDPLPDTIPYKPRPMTTVRKEPINEAFPNSMEKGLM